jgi:hypothetical protein
MKAFIEEICEKVGTRIAGSQQEAQAAQLIAQRLVPVSDEVSTDEVPIHIGVLAGLTNLLVAGVLLATVLYWFVPLAASILLIAVLLVTYLSRPRGKDVIDFLFPKGMSQNVVARLRPRSEVRQRVIFSGHHDSAYRMPFLNPPWKGYAYAIQTIATVTIIWLVLVALAKTAAPFAGWTFLWVGMGRWAPGDWLMLPGLLGAALTVLIRQLTVGSVPVPGAGDNLSAVAVAVGALELLSDARPEHTEVWAVSFGAEEIGAKGSRAFIDRHLADLQGTYVINMETLGAGQLALIQREVSVLTSHSPKAIALLQRAGQRVGVELPAKVIRMGDTDAAPFSRRGFWAATLYGMDETGLFVNWHTPEDSVENISPDKLQQALDICLGVVAELENQVGAGRV